MARPWKRRKPRPDPPKRTRADRYEPDLADIIERYRKTLFDAEVTLWYQEFCLEPALDEAVAALALIARLDTQPAASEVARTSLARVHHLLD